MTDLVKDLLQPLPELAGAGLLLQPPSDEVHEPVAGTEVAGEPISEIVAGPDVAQDGHDALDAGVLELTVPVEGVRSGPVALGLLLVAAEERVVEVEEVQLADDVPQLGVIGEDLGKDALDGLGGGVLLGEELETEGDDPAGWKVDQIDGRGRLVRARVQSRHL